MANSDNKKVGHLLTRGAEAAELLQKAKAKLVAVRAAYQTHSPDITGTPLEGNLAQANTWMSAVEALADDPVAAFLIANKPGRHREPTALGEGV